MRIATTLLLLASTLGCQSDDDPTGPDAGAIDATAYEGYDYQSNFVELSDGLTMHYLDEGDGDPIVMVHGLPTQAYMWRRVIPTVAQEARVIAPDLINFGLSDKTDPRTPKEQVAYLTEFIEQLGLQNVTLVLHDWGVAIGLGYAASHTDNIKGVVFFEGPFAPIPNLDTIPPWFAPNMLDPVTAEPNLLDDNWLVECFLLDPACGGTARQFTEVEKDVYRAPWTTRESREQILLFPQYLPFVDTTGHPVLDPDGPGGTPPLPAPDLDLAMGNAAWLGNAAVPKRFLYGMPGTLASGNGAVVAAELEASMSNLSSAQVGHPDTPNYHFIAEDTPDELADAVLDFFREL